MRSTCRTAPRPQPPADTGIAAHPSPRDPARCGACISRGIEGGAEAHPRQPRRVIRGVGWLEHLSVAQASLRRPLVNTSLDTARHHVHRAIGGKLLDLLAAQPHGRRGRGDDPLLGDGSLSLRIAPVPPYLTPPGPEFVDPRRSHGPYNTRNGPGNPGNDLLVRSLGSGQVSMLCFLRSARYAAAQPCPCFLEGGPAAAVPAPAIGTPSPSAYDSTSPIPPNYRAH